MQDNDAKHVSRKAKEFFDRNKEIGDVLPQNLQI